MWCLDPVNSGPLLDKLSAHARDGEFDVVWVGEGWRSLVEECHERLVEVFPDYELLNVKQKHGVLAFQAFPLMNQGQQRWSSAELDALESITEEFASRSETVCEWCGKTAVLRTWRTLELTLR